MDDEEFLVVGSENFEPIEDDDWRDLDRQIIDDTIIQSDSWVKPIDIFHSRGLDVGIVRLAVKGILDVCWMSDGLIQRCYADDFRVVDPPSDIDKLLAVSHKLLPMDSACPDREECSQSLSVGDFVQSRSVYSRYGSQAGLITGMFNGLFVIDWRHFKGHKPKDSKTSYRKKYWNRVELVKAHPNWIESYNKAQKTKQQSAAK